MCGGGGGGGGGVLVAPLLSSTLHVRCLCSCIIGCRCMVMAVLNMGRLGQVPARTTHSLSDLLTLGIL